MASPTPRSPPTLSVVSISLDAAHRRALRMLCRLTGRTAQSLLREGLDFVLSRYVPVEIKAQPGSRRRAERRTRRRVPTLTDTIDSPATFAARAVRGAYVAAGLAPSDPAAIALIEAAVAAAAGHGFVVKARARGGTPSSTKRARGPKRTQAPSVADPHPTRRVR